MARGGAPLGDLHMTQPRGQLGDTRIPGEPVSRNVTNGHTLFRVHCPKQRQIFLDIEVWEHIEEKHPEISSHEEVAAALREPSLIHCFENDPALRMYYRLIHSGPRKFRGLYLTVVVRMEEVGTSGAIEGVVKTAYLTRKPRAGGMTEWISKT